MLVMVSWMVQQQHAQHTHWSMMLMIGAAVAVVHLRPYDATHMSAATVTITHSMCYPSHKWHSHQQIKRLRCASTWHSNVPLHTHMHHIYVYKGTDYQQMNVIYIYMEQVTGHNNGITVGCIIHSHKSMDYAIIWRIMNMKQKQQMNGQCITWGMSHSHKCMLTATDDNNNGAEIWWAGEQVHTMMLQS